MSRRRLDDEEGNATPDWIPYEPELDWAYAEKVFWKGAATNQMLDFLTIAAQKLGNEQQAWWSRWLNLSDEDTRDAWNRFASKFVRSPIEMIPQLRESLLYDTDPCSFQEHFANLMIKEMVSRLGVPELILCQKQRDWLHYPSENYVSWDRIPHQSGMYALFKEQGVALKDAGDTWSSGKNYQLYTSDLTNLSGELLAGWCVKALNGGYAAGQIAAEFKLSDFTPEIQEFTRKAIDQLHKSKHVTFLAEGVKGSGKTRWTQSFAKEVLAPLGYVFIVVDRKSLAELVIPPNLKKVCIIFNEADNAILDRSLADSDGLTESVLALMDGSTAGYIEDTNDSSIAFLVTCNTSVRIDDAVFRDGRAGLIGYFDHAYAKATERRILAASTNGRAV